MPGIDVRMMSYGERVPTQDRYNSEESLEEENQSTTSSTESRQSDFAKKEEGFIPTRSSGILAGKPASNAGQFTRINSNPLLISAQKQMLLVEEVKKKKKEVKVGEDTPDWQSNLDGWKLRRRKQSEEAIVRVSEIKRVADQEQENGGRRKSSLGRKISLQIENDDQIDFDDLGGDDEEGGGGGEESGLRRESRGVSQEKAIPEEEEEEEDAEAEEGEEEEDEDEEQKEEIKKKNEKIDRRWDAKEDPKKGNTSNPYQSAIEGYKSFAQNHTIPSAPLSASSKESSPSSATSSLSSSSSSPPRKEDEKKGEEEWEEKIETFVQPARRVSSEVSATMRQKMASFTGAAPKVEKEKEGSPPTRPVTVSDNKFQDKLKAFKTIETAAAAPTPMSRRESEPVLGRPRQPAQFKTSLTSSSSSSSFMNTMQNAKFFQQNSLGSEEPEEEDKEAMEDALEESFNVLEGGKEDLVFSADDFSPRADGSLPPAEKPPPLPAVPPPPLHPEKEDETEIDKQEREIIESLEREEQEHKKYLETLNSPANRPAAGVEEKSSVATQSVQASSGSTKHWPGGLKKADSQGSMPVKKKEKESGQRDYSKHWLIQEAEQRRIAEAKQKQNLNHSSSSSGLEKIENLNNNNSGYGGDKRRDLVSDNIYANVDASNLNFNKNHGEPAPQIPGPQVPPRLGESGDRQDRVLSVSGKKRCSHCKEELGRGAAMIIESLRLFYHIRCFKCCVCSIQLGNGEQGTDVRVRNNRLHCQNCYSNDEGLKFSKV